MRAARRLVWTLAVSALSVFALSVSARSLSAQSPAADTVRQVDTSWGEAFRTCNLPVMDAVLHDDLVFIVQSGIIHHKKDQLASVGRCDMKQMDVQAAQVRVFGDTALVHGTLDYRLEGPRVSSGRLLYTRTYVRAGGRWRMIQHQSTAVPAR